MSERIDVVVVISVCACLASRVVQKESRQAIVEQTSAQDSGHARKYRVRLGDDRVGQLYQSLHGQFAFNSLQEEVSENLKPVHHATTFPLIQSVFIATWLGPIEKRRMLFSLFLGSLKQNLFDLPWSFCKEQFKCLEQTTLFEFVASNTSMNTQVANYHLPNFHKRSAEYLLNLANRVLYLGRSHLDSIC